MNSLSVISGLSEISNLSDVAFVDVWGVIHDGQQGFTGAIEACRQFRIECGPIILVSNSPRLGSALPVQFRSIGLPLDFFDAIVTSGDATQAALLSRAPGPAFKIGPLKDESIYHDLPLIFTDDIDKAKFISCTGLFDDQVETPEMYTPLLAKALDRQLEMVCANPDHAVMVAGRHVYCAGAIAGAYGKLGGHTVLCGKPFDPIYDTAEKIANELLGREIDPTRILAIGDGPRTDLAGANRRGYPALFVVDGLHGHGLAGDHVGLTEYAETILKDHEVVADAVIHKLSW